MTLDDVKSLITELVQETTRLQSVARSATEGLEARTREVRILTQRLEQAQSEALIDALTGLKNRRGFERALGEFGRLGYVPSGAALLLIDVDYFKLINDTHGHLLGDKVLKAIAQTLQSNIKGRDIAARMGG